jgi:hypothetical protein
MPTSLRFRSSMRLPQRRTDRRLEGKSAAVQAFPKADEDVNSVDATCTCPIHR